MSPPTRAYLFFLYTARALSPACGVCKNPGDSTVTPFKFNKLTPGVKVYAQMA